MSKLIWKPGTMIYPLPVVLVSVGDMEKANALTVAWTGIICSDPAMTYISIRKERYSYDIIKKNKEFVINIPNKDMVKALDYCGVRSGKNENKIEKMNLHLEKAENVKVPLIKEAPISIECKVKEIVPLGSHDMFIAEILSVDVDEKYMDKTGKFDMDKCNLIAYSHGQYYELGKKLGKFVFSVEKKSTKAKRKSNSKNLKK